MENKDIQVSGNATVNIQTTGNVYVQNNEELLKRLEKIEKLLISAEMSGAFAVGSDSSEPEHPAYDSYPTTLAEQAKPLDEESIVKDEPVYGTTDDSASDSTVESTNPLQRKLRK